ATAAAHKPDPKKKDKKRLAAGRAFTTPATKGIQGYQYVYIGRSRKIQRSEVRKHLANASVDLGRVLDICFPASHIIGVLLHVQYVEEFTALLTKAKGELFPSFDPLDPNNIADPKYAGLSDDDRHALIHEFTEARCLQTLSFLRPLNVSGVGKYFVQKGWICDESLSVAVAQAVERFAKKEPKKADFLSSSAPSLLLNNVNVLVPPVSVSLSLWNANGLRQSTVHDVLSHVLETHVLLVTETWLTSGSFPTNWRQFHLYGSKVPGAFNRGSGGITAFVSPSCPFTVSQLPSYNPHTLSLKVGALTVHCVYFPPPLSSDKVLSALSLLPMTRDTILCGDFNARLGSLTGDAISNTRGNALKPWFDEHCLSVLNASLAFGVKTYSSFRQQQEISSTIDLFLTNIGESAFLNAQLV
ncbi:hypothetical protein MAM1_1083d11450, partial [Mucor ambiguus]